mgnify:CR=1 FL=1
MFIKTLTALWIALLAALAFCASAQAQDLTGKVTRTPTGYLMVLRNGDDVIAHIERLAVVEQIQSASIFGIGFPPMQGGAIQYVNGYEAADGSLGVAAFAKRAQELTDTYGERFAPPASLLEKAKDGSTFE